MSSDGDHVLVERFAVSGSRAAKNVKLDRHSAPWSRRGKARGAELREDVPQRADDQHDEERDCDEASSAATRRRDFNDGFGEWCRGFGGRLVQGNARRYLSTEELWEIMTRMPE